MDSATTTVIAQLSKKKYLAKVRGTARRLLGSHGFSDDVRLEVDR